MNKVKVAEELVKIAKELLVDDKRLKRQAKMSPEKAKNIYWGPAPLPKGAKSLGEYVGLRGRGCLIELANGNKVVGNAGVIKNIPKGRY